MKTLLERLAAGETSISDGAMGAFLYAKGLGVGECPESWSCSAALAKEAAARRTAKELVEAGANIAGGCCGITPEHIAAIARALRQ